MNRNELEKFLHYQMSMKLELMRLCRETLESIFPETDDAAFILNRFEKECEDFDKDEGLSYLDDYIEKLNDFNDKFSKFSEGEDDKE